MSRSRRPSITTTLSIVSGTVTSPRMLSTVRPPAAVSSSAVALEHPARRAIVAAEAAKAVRKRVVRGSAGIRCIRAA
jgi:hypothetical protein